MAGFFDNYEDGSGLSFIGKEEKETLIEDATTLPVLRISRSTTRFGERFILITELDGEERALSFGTESVESRDRLLDAMMEYLTGDEVVTPEVRLERKGRSILIVDASSPAAEVTEE